MPSSLCDRTYKDSLMHCYEVIPEGAVCKLYFDLEFQRIFNPSMDGESMVAFLIQVNPPGYLGVATK